MRTYAYFCMTALAACCAACQAGPQAPVAQKISHEFQEFGNTRIDNYFWMRLSDAQKNAATPDAQTRQVLDYLEAENAYLQAEMAQTQALQSELFEELKGRIKPDDASVPYLDNGYFYFSKYEQGKEYVLYYRRANKEGAADELLLDMNQLAVGKSYCGLGDLAVSPNNQIMAYSVDYVSRRNYSLHFVDLRTGQHISDSIPNMTGGVVWANDNKTLFYVTKDPQTLRACSLYRHTLGSTEDQLCYFEEDETFSIGAFKSKSGKYIFVQSSQTLATETRYIDANRPEGAFRLFAARSPRHRYSVDHIGRDFYVLSNSDALNYKLMKTGETRTDESAWKEVIAHRPDVLLENMELFHDYLVVSEREQGLRQIRIRNLKSGAEQYVPFPEEVYTAGLSTNLSPELKELRYSYSSLTTPSSTYSYNMETGAVSLLKQTEVLGGFDKNNYESKRLWAKAADGTQVPISLVYRKGYPQDGTGKLLLYGYGSYGSSMNPSFNGSIVSLLDRGFAYAIAHIRGGSEMGKAWYEDGKLLKKKNTFTDFNDCAHYLIDQKYAAPSGLYASGGSAGGLLIGAVINMEPQLYKAVIAAVPFVDVVSTMQDATIPLTTFEWDEWGNPADKKYYDYMLSYSPYDQVEAKDYPHMLVTTGYWDSQVQYWEPAKWVAKLRDMKTDKNKLYMDCNMAVGHGGASGRFERLKRTALEYAFLLTVK
jgi:Protease II